MQDVRVKRDADVGSDHHLVVAEEKSKLLARKRLHSGRHRFDISKVRDQQYINEFHLRQVDLRHSTK